MIPSAEYDEIDWNEVWKERMKVNNTLKRSRGCSYFWNTKKKAREYAASSEEEECSRVRWVASSLPITADSRVLDIGAGPGSISIPVSSQVAEVTALEPSLAMREVLETAISEAGITNISIVGSHWEDVRTEDLKPPYDVVFASFSLGMPDLKEAVMKMNEVCSGTVVVFQFAGLPYWEQIMQSLWPALHGIPYLPGPKIDVLFNLLYSMGIYPDVAISPHVHTLRFPDLDLACDNLSGRFLIETPEQRAILREYLEERFRPDGDSILLQVPVHRARLTWKAPHVDQSL